MCFHLLFLTPKRSPKSAVSPTKNHVFTSLPRISRIPKNHRSEPYTLPTNPQTRTKPTSTGQNQHQHQKPPVTRPCPGPVFARFHLARFVAFARSRPLCDGNQTCPAWQDAETCRPGTGPNNKTGRSLERS